MTCLKHGLENYDVLKALHPEKDGNGSTNTRAVQKIGK